MVTTIKVQPFKLLKFTIVLLMQNNFVNAGKYVSTCETY